MLIKEVVRVLCNFDEYIQAFIHKRNLLHLLLYCDIKKLVYEEMEQSQKGENCVQANISIFMCMGTCLLEKHGSKYKPRQSKVCV
jgi:hypothetical protein